MRSKRPSVLAGTVLVLSALAACRSATPAHAPQAAPTPPAAARDAQTPALPSQAIRWTRSSAEHRAVFLEVYGAATAHVEREAARLAGGAWAVVLDADETVIDNSLYQLERERAGLPFDGPSWHEWTKRREALPQPGAKAFLARVRELGGRIAIVTNRAVSECPDTEAVFRAQRTGLRRDALQAGRGPERQEPALRGRRTGHDRRRAAAARGRGFRRRQHPRLPRARARPSATKPIPPSRPSARATSRCRIPCTGAGSATSVRGRAASPWPSRARSRCRAAATCA